MIMKHVCRMLLLGCLFLSRQSFAPAADQAADKAAIEKAIESYTAAFNAGDAKALFWSPPHFTVYDNQTRSELQTDQPFPGIVSNKQGLVKNADGSYDIYFGYKAPKGKEANWIQTVPGKGWNMLWRIYGPTKPWYDRSWKIGDPELVD